MSHLPLNISETNRDRGSGAAGDADTIPKDHQ